MKSKRIKTENCFVCSGKKKMDFYLNEDDTVSTFCHKCQTSQQDIYELKRKSDLSPKDLKKLCGDNPFSLEEAKEKAAKAAERAEKRYKEFLPKIKDAESVPKEYRGISPKWWEHYGVKLKRELKVFVPSEGKEISSPSLLLPMKKEENVVGWKVRVLKPKNYVTFGEITEADPFGWDVACRERGDTLYITEAEIDAVSLRAALGDNEAANYRGRPESVIGLRGVNTVYLIQQRLDIIQRYWKKVVIVPDNDEAGHAMARDIQSFIPHAQIVFLPRNDSNEMMQNGEGKKLAQLCRWRDVVSTTTTPVLTFKDVRSKINETPKMGAPTPWNKVTRMLKGIHDGVYLIAGDNGSGKTTLAHMLIHHGISQSGRGALCFMLEESENETYLNVGSKVLKRPLLAEGSEDLGDEDLDTLENEFGHNFIVFDHKRDRSNSPHELLETIMLTCRQNLGRISDVYLDNATKMTEGMNASERNDFISDMAAKLDTFARKHKITFWVLSHLNKQVKGARPYSEGGSISDNDVAGSSAFNRYANGVIYFERNKQGVDPNCSKIRIAKSRQGGKTGVVKTYYNNETTMIELKEWASADFETAK